MILDINFRILGKKKALCRTVDRSQSLLTSVCFLLSFYVIEFVEIRSAISELKFVKHSLTISAYFA
jgi:hypothetical protein